MLPFAVDEDFNNKLVRALLRRKPDLDIVSVSSLGFSEADDPTILEWAAQEGRVVLTHDVNTMTRYAYERVKAGKPMPGLFVVRRSVSIGIVLEDLLLLAECSNEHEWEGQVLFIPLR